MGDVKYKKCEEDEGVVEGADIPPECSLDRKKKFESGLSPS